MVCNIPIVYDVFFEFYKRSVNNDIKSMESMQHTKFYGLFYVKSWEVKVFMGSLVRPFVLNSGFRRYLFK